MGKLENYQSATKTKELINRYCTPAPENYEEKLIKQGKKLVTSWSIKLSNIKSDSDSQQLLTDLKTKKDGLNNLNEAGTENLLKDWCNDKIKEQLSNKEIKESDLIKRCFN